MSPRGFGGGRFARRRHSSETVAQRTPPPDPMEKDPKGLMQSQVQTTDLSRSCLLRSSSRRPRTPQRCSPPPTIAATMVRSRCVHPRPRHRPAGPPSASRPGVAQRRSEPGGPFVTRASAKARDPRHHPWRIRDWRTLPRGIKVIRIADGCVTSVGTVRHRTRSRFAIITSRRRGHRREGSQRPSRPAVPRLTFGLSHSGDTFISASSSRWCSGSCSGRNSGPSAPTPTTGRS